MYNLEKVPSKNFKILLSYLKTMKKDSGSRQRIFKDAKEIVENGPNLLKLDKLEEQLISEVIN